MLRGEARQLGELLPVKICGVKMEVDVAALVYGPPQRGHLFEVGAFETAYEYADRGHAAEDGGAGFGFGFLIE